MDYLIWAYVLSILLVAGYQWQLVRKKRRLMKELEKLENTSSQTSRVSHD